MDEKAVLTSAQLLELQDIDEESNHGDGWCDVSEVSRDVLKELDKEHYIITNEARTSGRITVMGKRALANHVLRGSAEHGRMLLDRSERVSAKPYESVVRKPNGDIPQRPVPPKKTCVVEGCNEPRMVRKDGAEMTRCVKHHGENLSERRRRGSDRHDQKILAEAAKAIEAEEGSTLLTPGAQTVAAESDCNDCGDCVYREVLDTLRAKFPGIDEMVYLAARLRELRNELGI